MSTSLKFEGPPDLSVGRIKISNESGMVGSWMATPGDLTFPTQSVKPGYYTAEIAPAGVTPQSVIFEVKEGVANTVSLPSFSALSATGSAPSFINVDNEQAALEALYKPQKESSVRSEATLVPLDLRICKISVGLSQENEGRRESFGPFRGTFQLQMAGERAVLDVHGGDNWLPWSGQRVRLSTAIQGVKVERQLLPMYRDGTTIGITPSALASADVEYQVTPADPRIRALLRSLQGGTSDEASALRKTLLAEDQLPALLSRETGDPWGAILAGLLFIRFPDIFGTLDEDWTDALVREVGWAYDSHVIRAHQLIAAADESEASQNAAAQRALAALAKAPPLGAPYYSYTNQLFGEMAEGLKAFYEKSSGPNAKSSAALLARWRRQAPLQNSSDTTFSWLSRDQKALKEGRLAPYRSPSGLLRAYNTTVVLKGTIQGNRITVARNAAASADSDSAPPGMEMTEASAPPIASTTPPMKALKSETRPKTFRGQPHRATPSPDDDPNLGQFGGNSEVGGYLLDATFQPTSNRDWITVVMSVTASRDTKVELDDVAWFCLHPDFSPRWVKVLFNDGRATLSVQAWGGFTIGAWLPRPDLKLECNLALLDHAPRIIKTR